MSKNILKNHYIYGLSPENSKISLQLNCCFLLAKHYIVSCRANKKMTHLTSFLALLTPQFHIESHNLGANSKK